MIPPTPTGTARPTHCPTAARHVLAWAPDGANAATCVPHPLPARSGCDGVTPDARTLGACRDRVWAWWPPVDGLGTGRLSQRGVPVVRAGQALALTLWEGYLAERRRAARDAKKAAQKGATG